MLELLSGIFLILMFGGVFLLYFAPTCIAIKVDHPNQGGIFVLNLVLGFTVVGWFAALIWAMTKPAKSGGQGEDENSTLIAEVKLSPLGLDALASAFSTQEYEVRIVRRETQSEDDSPEPENTKNTIEPEQPSRFQRSF